jgi:hypothetical protein
MRAIHLFPVLTLGALSASCSPSGFPPFEFLGADAGRVVVRTSSDGAPYRYVVRREPSSTEVTLRAVALSRLRGYAAGDGGVVLRRTHDEPWRREVFPVATRLRALHVAPDEAARLTDRSETPVYAVGDGGVIARRSQYGVWERESSGTTRDLHALTEYDESIYAAGDGGTVLERRGGRWRTIVAGTSADLRAMLDTTIAGLGGALVHCTRVAPVPGAGLTCAPRPSPTDRDLLAVTYTTSQPWQRSAFGAPGVHLILGKDDAWERAAHPLGGTVTVHAALPAGRDVLLAGSGGVLGFVSAAGAERAVVPGEPDLRALAYRGEDVFAVGDRGTIVHLRGGGVIQMYAVQQ